MERSGVGTGLGSRDESLLVIKGAWNEWRDGSQSQMFLGRMHAARHIGRLDGWCTLVWHFFSGLRESGDEIARLRPTLRLDAFILHCHIDFHEYYHNLLFLFRLRPLH